MFQLNPLSNKKDINPLVRYEHPISTLSSLYFSGPGNKWPGAQNSTKASFVSEKISFTKAGVQR